MDVNFQATDLASRVFCEDSHFFELSLWVSVSQRIFDYRSAILDEGNTFHALSEIHQYCVLDYDRVRQVIQQLPEVKVPEDKCILQVWQNLFENLIGARVALEQHMQVIGTAEHLGPLDPLMF